MELALSLGDYSPNSDKPFGFISKPSNNKLSPSSSSSLMALGFSVGSCDEDDDEEEEDEEKTILPGSVSGLDPPVQLHLLPLAPIPLSSNLRFPCLSHRLMPEVGSLDVKRVAAGVAAPSCRNSNGGSGSRSWKKRSSNMEMESEEDEDQNIGSAARKKLRLSKQQSAFLEQSFKQHTTLNPKQKLALAKQLNLRPRQVEVWFQNRRARTKLKQTEVDCEYLRRCCETLTEENRRLQKELQELRALKTSLPFYKQLPPTTLTMCPSCERVSTTTVPAPNPTALCLAIKPTILPFPHLHQAA